MQDEDAIWDIYNSFLLGPDIERLRKLLARCELFRMTLDVPGDIVECGVFKGTGLMLWLKLREIYCSGSNKKVIGFDLFSDIHEVLSNPQDLQAMEGLIQEANFQTTPMGDIQAHLQKAQLAPNACELVAGDIRKTAADYVSTRPGFRISLLHLDLDLEGGTLAALEAFWPRVVRGGLVIFDEYGVQRWSESQAVDSFFADKSVKLKAVPWSRTPTAYMVKE